MKAFTAIAAVFIFAPVVPGPLVAQTPQTELARILEQGSRARQMMALEEVSRLSVSAISPELRLALIRSLEREAALTRERWAGRHPTVDDPEMIARLALAVGRLEDPRAVVGLAGALGSAPVAMDHLVPFGEDAAVAILDVLQSTGKTPPQQDGLIALRFMIERKEELGITPETLERIRNLAAEYLNGGRHITLFWRTIDLAAAFDDPELDQTLRVLASDDSALAARGVTARDLARTRQILSARLAEVPPLPRHGH